MRCHAAKELEEVFVPFHVGTIQTLILDIDVAAASDLVLLGISITKAYSSLEVVARLDAAVENSWGPQAVGRHADRLDGKIKVWWKMKEKFRIIVACLSSPCSQDLTGA